MPSQNALRDIIYRDPIGTETLTGMQSATPIDEYANLHRALQIGLPIASGFAGGTTEGPQFQSMADFIQLLRSLQGRLPRAGAGQGVGAVGITRPGMTTPDVETYLVSPAKGLGLRMAEVHGDPYLTSTRESDYYPAEAALDRLMSWIYRDWGEPGERSTPYKPGGGR